MGGVLFTGNANQGNNYVLRWLAGNYGYASKTTLGVTFPINNEARTMSTWYFLPREADQTNFQISALRVGTNPIDCGKCKHSFPFCLFVCCLLDFVFTFVLSFVLLLAEDALHIEDYIYWTQCNQLTAWGGKPPLDRWFHIAFVMNGTHGYHYLDGVKSETSVTPAPLLFSGVPNFISLGSMFLVLCRSLSILLLTSLLLFCHAFSPLHDRK
jgi:hypothetical protein